MTGAAALLSSAFLLAGACRATEAPMPAVQELAADQVDPSVRIAVQVRKGMRAAPAQGDSILAAVHLSATQFESLMRRIAADSVMSADYLRLTR